MKRLVLSMAASVAMLTGTVVGAQSASALPLCGAMGGSDGYELVLRCAYPMRGLQWEVLVYCPRDPGHRASPWRSSYDTITMRCHGIKFVKYTTRWA